MDYTKMSFDMWMELGIEKGWVGAPVCSTHDGVPTSAEEDEAWEDGDDLCIHVLRLYRSQEEKKNIEQNHAPSRWRNPFHVGG